MTCGKSVPARGNWWRGSLLVKTGSPCAYRGYPGYTKQVTVKRRLKPS